MSHYDGFRPKDMNILLIFHHDSLLLGRIFPLNI